MDARSHLHELRSAPSSAWPSAPPAGRHGAARGGRRRWRRAASAATG